MTAIFFFFAGVLTAILVPAVYQEWNEPLEYYEPEYDWESGEEFIDWLPEGGPSGETNGKNGENGGE